MCDSQPIHAHKPPATGNRINTPRTTSLQSLLFSPPSPAIPLLSPSNVFLAANRPPVDAEFPAASKFCLSRREHGRKKVEIGEFSHAAANQTRTSSILSGRTICFPRQIYPFPTLVPRSIGKSKSRVPSSSTPSRSPRNVCAAGPNPATKGARRSSAARSCCTEKSAIGRPQDYHP